MSELFLNLFNRAMAAGWLVLAVLLLRLVLKKAPRWIHCSLWGLVGLRLVWPFSVESMLSLLPSREVLPPSVLYNPAPTVQSGIGTINAVVNGSFTPAMTATPGASVNPLQVWTWLVGWIWLLGAAALLGYGLFSYVRLRKRVAVSVEENGLYRCDAIGSPFILGIFRPKIYVPSDLDPETLPYVLAHEQAHLQRKDHWWKPLGYLLLTVFWFHPLLWAAYVLLCRDIERACDERVIRSMDGAGRKAYSMALVDCAADRRAIAACPVAFGETGVKQRVWSVLHYQKPAFWLVVLAVVLSIAAAVCFLTDPVGFQLDFALEDIAQATTMDLRMNAGPVTGELNKAQQEELWFRLRDLKQTKRRDDYGGFTPFYSMYIQLDDGTWVRIQGYALDGSMVDLVQGDEVFRVDDPDFQDYLNRMCAGGAEAAAQPASGPAPAPSVETALHQTIASLQPGDLWAVSQHNSAGQIDLEDLRLLLQEAVQQPVPDPGQIWIWMFQLLLPDQAIDLYAGLAENVVQIWDGETYLYVENEELYRLVRTCNDTPPAGVDEEGYALCRELVDGHLQYIPGLPAGLKKEQITKELTGFVLHDRSEKLNAQAWRMDVAWNVVPPEQAYALCAGASYVNSDLQLIGANASEKYVIVIDGEPIGFVGWWFLMDKTLDDQYETKEALLEAVRNDG